MAWVNVGGFLNLPAKINVNAMQGGQVSVRIRSAFGLGMQKQRFGLLAFSVNRTGTLSLPKFSQNPYMMQENYTLPPGESVTLTYNGTVALGPGLLTANFTKGSKYVIDVIGDEGAFAQSNVTVN